MYSETTLDHIHNPRHVGQIADATGSATIGEPGCGDFMSFYIKVVGDVIRDVSFLCKGCPAAVACGSATCELALGKSLRESIYITEETVSEYLGGLPKEKIHCASLSVATLRSAIGDHLGIKSRQNAGASMIERLRNAVRRLAEENGLLDTPLRVEARSLPPELAIGEDAKRDYPIWKGREGIVEASFLGGKGQAFSAFPMDYSGTLQSVLETDLEGDDQDAVGRRGIFVSVVNAVCSHLGIAAGVVHCRNEGPVQCAQDLVQVIRMGFPDDSRITLIGCQPRMIEALSSSYALRVVDMDPDNIGKSRSGVIVEDPAKTDEALDWCSLALVTGSALVNGTIDRFVGLKCHTVFYGITIAGAAALLRLNRFCTRAS